MKLSPDQKAGLYITVSIHLAVIIVLLLVGIRYETKKENSFVLDFSAQEEVEKLEQQRRLKETLEQRLEQLLAASAQGEPVRNIAVDRSTLKDDRGTDAEKLYEEAERLARELRDGKDVSSQEDDWTARETQPQEQKKTEQKPYSGPSVLSWSLDGRKALDLKIPAYRCYGAGEVTVVITVDGKGKVVNAKVEEGRSSRDACLQEFAIRAARLSRFNGSATAPARQLGTITYAFIAQ